VKIQICVAFELLASMSEYNIGMKPFSVGLVRSMLGLLQHRQAKVRLAAISSIQVCITIPDKVKRKGAGSEAIRDLVGFQDGNTIAAASFYTASTTLNYLAIISTDNNIAVRERVAEMLVDLLTTLPDRYDHQTRLLPYLLDLLVDEASTVQSTALLGLLACGEQFETEHKDDLIERKQFAVDGDDRINLSLSPPRPFDSRPPLGVRLFVKGNVKRFLHALIDELTNWQAPTRLKSAKLLNIVLFLCEDHLTIEAHTLLPCFLKSLRCADSERDRELERVIMSAVEMYGRYTPIPVCLHILQPYLQGTDVEEEVKRRAIRVLAMLLRGSKSSQIVLHFDELVLIVLPLLEGLLSLSQEESHDETERAKIDLYRTLCITLTPTDMTPVLRCEHDDEDDDYCSSIGGADQIRRVKYLVTMKSLHEKFENGN
jgi:hypothetical protein